MPSQDDDQQPVPQGQSVPELLQHYRSEHARLVAQSRELERLRARVLSSAEREASVILTDARREIRQILTKARNDLVVLAAQIQAAGCTTDDADLADGLVTGVSAVVSVDPASAQERSPVSTTLARVTSARREVRDVLLDARAELAALSEEATELRARMAAAEAARNAAAGRAAEGVAVDSPGVRHGGVQTPGASVSQVHPPRASEPGAASLPPARAASHPPPPPRSADLPPRALLGASPPDRRGSRRQWAVAAVLVLAAAAVALAVAVGGSAGGSATREAPAASPVPPAVSPAETASAADADPKQTERRAESASGATASTIARAVPANSAPVSVRIEVQREAWLRTTVDGRADLGRIYNAGQTRTIPANEEVIIRAGDAGAVLVSVNGAPGSPLGADGQVVTRRFGRSLIGSPGTVSTAGSLPKTPSGAPPVEQPVPQRGPSAQVLEPDRMPADPPPAVPRDGDTSAASAAGTPSDVASVEIEIQRLTARWIDTYFSGDPVALASSTPEQFALVDSRPPSARIAPGTPAVVRSLDDVRVEVAGNGAVLSARLVERMPGAQGRQNVSFISAVWTVREGEWVLMVVRLGAPLSPPSR